MFKSGKCYSMTLNNKVINFKVINYSSNSGTIEAHYKGTMISLLFNINDIDVNELKSIRQI